MKKVLRFVKGRRDDRKDGITPSSSGDLLSPAQTPEDERFLGLDSASGYIVDFCGKDKTLTKLHKAAWQGNLEKLKSALKKIDIDAVDRHNRTPLHFAVVQGHPNIVWFLLGNNARHTVCDSEGRTPLLKAVECCHKECMTLLLERGANVNHADFSGMTPLHIAVKQGSTDITSLLLQKGADSGLANNNGEYPLHMALRTENKENVKLLLQNGAPVNAVDRENRTPLMLAARNGNLVLAQLLFEYGAHLFVTDSNGWTAEDYAMLGGHQTVASELKALMKKELKPALESHREEEEDEMVKSDIDTWNDSNPSDVPEKPENKVGQFLRKLSSHSGEDVESPGSGVLPPPCQPPRSWEIIEAGMIDEAVVDGSEPKRRSITALGSLHSRRESFTETHNDGPKYTLSLNRRRDSKKNTQVHNRFSFNEEESLKSSISDEFSILNSGEKKRESVLPAANGREKLPPEKGNSESDWDSNLSSLLESSSGHEGKIKKCGPLEEPEGTLGRRDTLNEVDEIWISGARTEQFVSVRPPGLQEEDDSSSGESFHEGVFPPPPTAFELGADMAKSMSYMKGISIDTPDSIEEEEVRRKVYEQSQSLDGLEEVDEARTNFGDEKHRRNPSISNHKWRSVELPRQHHPSNRIDVNKRIRDQLECYDQALRELAESPYAKKPDPLILIEKKSELSNYHSLPSSKIKADKEFSQTGKTKAIPSNPHTMSLPLQFKRPRTLLLDNIDGGPSSLPFAVNEPSKNDELENNESLGFEEEIRPKPDTLNFEPSVVSQIDLESPMSDDLTGSDKSDRKSKRHMLLAMRDVKHAVQVTNTFKTSLDEHILSPLTKTEGEFDLGKIEKTSPKEENLFFHQDSQEFGRQETVIERAKSSPSDSGDEPTLWLQDKAAKQVQAFSGPTSEEEVAPERKTSRKKSASSVDTSPLSNGIRGRRTPSAALQRLQRLGSSSENEDSVKERAVKVPAVAVEGSPDVSLSSGPIEPLNRDSGSDPDSSVKGGSPIKHYSLKKHHKWLKERLQAENKEKQKLEEFAAQLAEKAERLQYELEDAKEASKSRDEIITLLQAQLNRMEAAYTKSLEESVHCRLQLTTLEQEIFHLKELCSQYEEEREIKGASPKESQNAMLLAKIKQLEEERENLAKEVVRMEGQRESGKKGEDEGADAQWKERYESQKNDKSQLIHNGTLPSSSENSLERRNNELERQISLANEINRRLEDKLDKIIKTGKIPISEDLNRSILTLSEKNSEMEKQLKNLVQQLTESKKSGQGDQSVIDRLNDEKILLVKSYEKQLSNVSNDAMESLKKENDLLTQSVKKLQKQLDRLMQQPNLEERRLSEQKTDDLPDNKEIPDEPEVEILRKKVESLKAALGPVKLKGIDGRPVRKDELAWSNLYGIKSSGRRSRASPVLSLDKDSEEFIELKVKELERELDIAKEEIIRQRFESDFRIQAMPQTTEIVELKKKVIDLENRALTDDSLRLSLQAKTAEMALGMKERRELEFELQNLKLRMQREFVPKIDAEVAKIQADLLARKVSESRVCARAIEDGLRERLEALARERERADTLRRRLGRQCVSWETSVGAPGVVPPVPFRSLPRGRFMDAFNPTSSTEKERTREN